MKIKKMLVFVCFCLSLLFLIACGKSKNENIAASTRDTLFVANNADVKSLDPHASNDTPSARVRNEIYNRIAEFDENSNPRPSLAESWEQVDSTTTIIKLKKGVKFHNGEELKASDVKFTLDRMKNSPAVRYIIDMIDTVEVVDDYTVKITTTKPFAPLISHLTHNATSILNEKAVTEAKEAYAQHPIGTGPYKFISWTSGDRVVLEAFPEYFEGETPIKNLVFRTIVEEANRTIGLETGELDIIYDIVGLDKDKLKNDKNFNYMEKPGITLVYLGFNLNKPPFDNPKVREAISYAIDQNALIQTAYFGAGIKANSIIGPNIFSHYDVDKYEYNVEKAKKLLEEAGYKDGFKTKIWIRDNSVYRDMAIILQDELKQIGIDLTVETLEWGAFLDGTARGEHEIFILTWSTVTRDPDYGIAALVSTKTHGGAGNRTFYSNPKVDELLEIGRSELNTEKRKEIYREIQEIIRKDVPMYMLLYPTVNAVTRKDIKNFNYTTPAFHTLYGVSIEN